MAKAKTAAGVAAAPQAEEPAVENCVTVVEEASTTNLPSTDVMDLSALAGMGREETRAEDYSIPFLRIIQKMSPEVDESSGKYIEGAKPGDFLNTVSGQTYSGKDGLVVIPCLFHREYVEWVPRDKGGGFVGHYQADDPVVATAKAPEGGRNLVLPNGNDLIDTYYEYALCKTPDGDVFPAVLSFTSTQTKKIRKWNSMMASKRLTLADGRVLSDPPTFAFYYLLTTVSEKNERGSWHGWGIAPVEKPNDRVPDHELREALTFYKQVKSGEVKRAPEHNEQAEAGEGDDYIPGFEAGSGQQNAF